MTKDMWETLGIEETKDRETILNAYRNKVVTVNPEDDQEGFMKLREAYEAAIRFAENDSEKTKNPNNEIRYSDNDEVDAAVKTHIKKLEVIYNDIDKRRNPELWREWLDDEVCKNLDSVDPMCEALLVFLMKNHCIPFKMWKMMDERFGFVGNKENLSEKFAGEYLEFVEIQCKNDDYGDYDDYSKRDIYYEFFSDLIPEISVYADEKIYEAREFPYADDEYISNMLRISAYFNDYFDNYLYFKKTGEKEHKEEMDKSITFISNILERCDRAKIFTPVELGARILLLEIEGKCDMAFKLSKAVFERWEKLHYYATNNAMKILIKNIDRFENKTEILNKIYEKVEKLEELHPEYNSTKKVRFALFMLDNQFKEADEKIREVLNENSSDLEAVIFFKIVTDKETEIYNENMKNGSVSEQEKMDAALRYYQNTDIDHALLTLNKIEGDQVDQYEYHKLYSICYSEKKKYDLAEEHFKIWKELLEQIVNSNEPFSEKDEEKAKNVAQCYMKYAFCLEKLGKIKEAEELYKKDIEFSNSQAEIRFKEAYGKFLQNCKRYDEAMRIWEEFIKKPDFALLGYIHRQETAYKMQRGQMVVDDYYEIINRYRLYPKAYYYAADVFYIYDQIEEAKKVLENAKKEGLSSDLLRMLNARILRTRGFNTYEEYARGQSEVTQIYDKVLRNIEASKYKYSNDNDVSDVMDELEMVYGEVASFYLRLVDRNNNNIELNKAEEYVNKGLSVNPKGWRLLLILADIKEKKGYKADDIYRKLMDYYPKSGNAYFEYANYLERKNPKGDKEEKCFYYEKTIEYDPENIEALKKLKDIYISKYRNNRNDTSLYRKAVDYANRMLKLNPDAHYYVERGFVYLDGGDFDYAIADGLSAIEADQDYGYAYNMLCKVYYRKNDLEKAIENGEKAIKLLNNDENRFSAVFYNLIKAYEKAMRYDEALATLDEALKYYDEEESDRDIYERIYRKKKDKTNAQKLGTRRLNMDLVDYKKTKNGYYVIAAYLELIKTNIIFNEIEVAKRFEKEMEKKLKEMGVSPDGKKKNSDLNDKMVFDILKSLGYFYMDVKRDYKKALKCYMSLEKMDKQSNGKIYDYMENIYDEYAMCLLFLKKKSLAKKYADKTLDIIKQKAGSIENYTNDFNYGPLYTFKAGWMLYISGDKERAMKLLSKGENCTHCCHCNKCRCYDIILAYALIAEIENRIDDAIRLYQEAYKIAPDDVALTVALRSLGAM